MTTVSIITPVWNRADMTFNFLSQHYRIFAHRDDIEYIIIDNGSTDGTPGILKVFSYKLPLKIITLPKNIGFGPANNLAAKQASGDILILVNNDVRLEGDYITPLVRELEYSPEIIAGKELLDYDTGWNVFDGQIIPYIHGWLMALTRRNFELLGGFDDRFAPADYEDIDFCYTATEREGFALVDVPTLPIRHLGGQTVRQIRRHIITERNRERFAKKWGFEKWGFNEPLRVEMNEA
jgi:GT2 family glycosyltransferase